MKKFILILLASIIAINAYSQGGLVYRGFGVEETNRSQSQTLKTTAYSQNRNGEIEKMPIIVEVTQTSYGTVSMKVIAAWVSNGYSGGWQKVMDNRVDECRPIYSSSSNQMDNYFMYKANLIVGTVRTWYFDL